MAIAGQQMFSGMLKYRCASIDGVIDLSPEDGVLCGGGQGCGVNEICVKGTVNPYYNVISFDNFASAYMMAFQISTLEGWSIIMTYLRKASGIVCIWYF